MNSLYNINSENNKLSNIRKLINERRSWNKRRDISKDSRKGEGERGEGVGSITSNTLAKPIPSVADMSKTERDDARCLSLHWYPESREAIALRDELTSTVDQHVKSTRTARRTLKGAVGALLAGVLQTASQDLSLFSYRSMSSGSFTGHPIGYHAFKKAFDGFYQAGLLEAFRGESGGTDPAWATRLRATSKLIDLATERGVLLSDWSSHFQSLPRPKTIERPVIVKSASRLNGRNKIKGVPMGFDMRWPKPAALGAQVNEINAFLVDVRIEPAGQHWAFHRIFNLGNTSEFDWNKGGRLYSIGGGYQLMSQSDRKSITFDGEPTVEIDLRASHITILHAQRGIPFDPHSVDPYTVPGIDREWVKAFATMTLGYDRYQRAWSKPVKARFLEKTGQDLQKVHPIREARETILIHLPVLRDWRESEIRWGDLQYLESCVIVGTVYRLATEHGVPALPVHDSVIVPSSKQALAEQVLSEEFQKHIGVQPALSTK